jgi:hypothetical protein
VSKIFIILLVGIFFLFIGSLIRRNLAVKTYVVLFENTIFGFVFFSLAASLYWRYVGPFDHMWKVFFYCLTVFLVILNYKNFYNLSKIRFSRFYIKPNLPISSFFSIFFFLGILLLPATADINFRVFQGNQWDHFSYQTTAINSKFLGFQETLNAANNGLFQQRPSSVIAYANIFQRPGAPLALGALSKLFGFSILDYSYSYLLCTVLLLIMSSILLLRLISHKASFSRLSWILILAAYIGFWGQYVLDSNAWSYLSTAFSNVYLIYRLHIFILKKSIANFSHLLIISIYSFLLYPEAYFPYLLMLLGYAFLLKRNLLNVLYVTVLGFLSIVIVNSFGYKSLAFTLNQYGFANSTQTNTWSNYWQAYLMGWSGDTSNLNIFENFKNFYMGFVGLYFYSPSKIDATNLIGLLYLLIALSVLTCLVLALTFGFKNFVRTPLVILFFLFIPFMILTSLHSTLWVTGKFITFLIPLVIIVFAFFLIDLKSPFI